MSTINPVGIPAGAGRGDTVDKSDKAPSGADAISTTRRGADQDNSPGPSRDSDAVNLSESARQAARIDRAIEREPFFDDERVAALRSAIENGEYEVNTQQLARAITQLELLT